MAKKNLWLGMLVVVLVFGMTVVGCDPNSDDDSTNGNGNGGSGNNGGNSVVYAVAGRASEVIIGPGAMFINEGQYDNAMRRSEVVKTNSSVLQWNVPTGVTAYDFEIRTSGGNWGFGTEMVFKNGGYGILVKGPKQDVQSYLNSRGYI
jgi:hypothetical protein